MLRDGERLLGMCLLHRPTAGGTKPQVSLQSHRSQDHLTLSLLRPSSKRTTQEVKAQPALRQLVLLFREQQEFLLVAA